MSRKKPTKKLKVFMKNYKLVNIELSVIFQVLRTYIKVFTRYCFNAFLKDRKEQSIVRGVLYLFHKLAPLLLIALFI